MTYATVQDYLEQVGEDEAIMVSNLGDPTDRALNRKTIETGLEGAFNEINAILGARYDLYSLSQVDPPPPFLVQAEVVIARKILEKVSRREFVYQDYKDIIARLTAIIKDQGVLIDASGNVIPKVDLSDKTATGVVSWGISEGGQTFNNSSLSGFMQGSRFSR